MVLNIVFITEHYECTVVSNIAYSLLCEKGYQKPLAISGKQTPVDSLTSLTLLS